MMWWPTAASVGGTGGGALVNWPGRISPSPQVAPTPGTPSVSTGLWFRASLWTTVSVSSPDGGGGGHQEETARERGPEKVGLQVRCTPVPDLGVSPGRFLKPPP